jgi:HD domain protein
MNIDRDEVVDLLNKYVITEHIKTHSYAVEAVMRAPAKRLAPD